MLQRNNHIRKLSVYFNLIKYKLSAAVAFSAATGYFLHRNEVGPGFFSLVTGIFLLAAGSSVLNQYTEREQDAIMPRTRNRPLAAKKLKPGTVFLLSAAPILSGGFLLILNGFVPFALGCLAVILYNLLYTKLKRITVLAIVPGALVGAIPPLIGFTSAGGTELNDKIIFFSAFMFLWQIPHFWLLLIRYGKEYQAAGFKTISDHLNEREIKFLVFFWILASAGGLIFFSVITGMLNKYLSIILINLNILFIITFLRFLFPGKGTLKPGNVFIIFNSYSIITMLLLIADSFLGGIGN